MTISQVQGCQLPLEYLLEDRYYTINFKLPDATWTLDGVEHTEELIALGRKRGEEEFDAVATRFFESTTAPYALF